MGVVGGTRMSVVSKCCRVNTGSQILLRILAVVCVLFSHELCCCGFLPFFAQLLLNTPFYVFLHCCLGSGRRQLC